MTLIPIESKLPDELSDIRYLKGVGPKRALALEKIGIRSIRDLLYFFPRRYEDRSIFRNISETAPGQFATVRAEVMSVKVRPIRSRPMLEVLVGDKTGLLQAVWFNQVYLKSQFREGQQVILFGKVDYYKRRLQMNSPEYEFLDKEEAGVHTGRITPIYPLTEGLFQKSLRTSISEAVTNQLPKAIVEYLPECLRQEKELMGLQDAVREIHFPSSHEKLAIARKRVIFDEFFIFELTLLRKIERFKKKYKTHRLTGGSKWLEEFRAGLPFDLTASQETAIADLVRDLASACPMNRLLMGDVGSGKTVVSAFAMLVAAKCGRQSALLVPTEILAVQHFRTLSKILAPFGMEIKLLTSNTSSRARERLLAELKQNKISAVVGTHSLLQADVEFKELSLVVVDEQHKFGVHQRCKLLESSPRPHQLVMTATPIPRTLALTVYGDLEVSAMREMPAGRKEIKTFWITRKKQREVLKHIYEKAKNEEQAYFIFPLIEETEKSDMLAAKAEFENLRSGVFKNLKIGLVHGRMGADERDAVMKAFREGELRVLVATSVVEVGVDNPNATMMIIENAERFGLSQLHQMRGRIGRGAKPSECFLFGEPKTDEGKKRLRIMTKTSDGFVIAEEDLKLRGPGDFWGTRQSGEPIFKVADPLLDYAILEDARKTAIRIVKEEDMETASQWAGLKNYLDHLSLRY